MSFDVEKVTTDIIEFIQDYYKKNNLKGAVIGISGGKDSAVVAALFTRALGCENVLGLWMPCNSKENDYKDAQLLCNELKIELKEFDLTTTYNLYLENIQKENKVFDHELINANINLKPRLRMSTLYYYAAMMTKQKNETYIVAGTSNKCERFVGYFTKGGDNVCDISVLGDLLVSEVIMLGDYLKIPTHIVHKIPDDGLSNQTDEEKLGVKYEDIEKYICEEETGIKTGLQDEVRRKIKRLHEVNSHKFTIPMFRRK